MFVSKYQCRSRHEGTVAIGCRTVEVKDMQLRQIAQDL